MTHFEPRMARKTAWEGRSRGYMLTKMFRTQARTEDKYMCEHMDLLFCPSALHLLQQSLLFCPSALPLILPRPPKPRRRGRIPVPLRAILRPIGPPRFLHLLGTRHFSLLTRQPMAFLTILHTPQMYLLPRLRGPATPLLPHTWGLPPWEHRPPRWILLRPLTLVLPPLAGLRTRTLRDRPLPTGP